MRTISLTPLFRRLLLLGVATPFAACGGLAIDDRSTQDPGGSDSGIVIRGCGAGAGMCDAGSRPQDAGVIHPPTHDAGLPPEPDAGTWDSTQCGEGGGTPTVADGTCSGVTRQVPCGIDTSGGADLPSAQCALYCNFGHPDQAECRVIGDGQGSGKVLSCFYFCGGGRRPEGFVPSSDREAAPMAEHFARLSELEHASVAAFEDLTCELIALGAPSALTARTRAAAADEIRHAEAMGALAKRFGSARGIRVAAVPAREARSVLAVAIENAVEGCVRETYAALVASFGAEHASDTAVRTALREIATDETRHAELSWDILRFLDARLTAEERVQVRDAMQRAVGELYVEAAAPLAPDFATHVGIPNTTRARDLLSGLQHELWAV